MARIELGASEAAELFLAFPSEGEGFGAATGEAISTSPSSFFGVPFGSGCGLASEVEAT
jgi:hypothetical protein